MLEGISQCPTTKAGFTGNVVCVDTRPFATAVNEQGLHPVIEVNLRHSSGLTGALYFDLTNTLPEYKPPLVNQMFRFSGLEEYESQAIHNPI